MPTLRRIHVATPGDKRTRNGTSLSLSYSDLTELAESYSPDLHQCKVAVDDIQTAIQLGAPAVLGHLDPRLVLGKGALPAFGRVLSAEAGTKGLWLDLELTESMAGYMKDGMYDHVSLSWYDRHDSRNPTPGKLHIRHLGVLGREGSSMKDLELPNADLIEFSESTNDDGSVYQVIELTTPLEFAESDMDPSVTAEDQTSQEAVDETVDPVQLLISTLSDGPKGYKGEITGFNPEPTEDNSYLWDADAQQFVGQFLDNSGNEEEIYDFTLKLQEDGSMIRSYKRLILDDIEAAAVTDAGVEAEANVADDPGVEMSEAETDVVPETVPEGEPMPIFDIPEPEPMVTTVSIEQAEYEALLAKATLYNSMLEEQAERQRQDQIDQLRFAIQPLYDMGLISSMVSADSIARALMSMSEKAEDCCDDDGYSLEFSEGEVHTRPMETVLAVFSQIGANAKIQKDTEIELGEMDLPEIEFAETETKQPAGTVANPKQAELDKKARKYCKDNDLDPKDSKQYMKAIKAVS